MRTKVTIILSAVALVLLAGCALPETETRDEAIVKGAGLGALAGLGGATAFCFVTLPFSAGAACPPAVYFVGAAAAGAVVGGIAWGVAGRDLPRTSDPAAAER